MYSKFLDTAFVAATTLALILLVMADLPTSRAEDVTLGYCGFFIMGNP